MRKFLRVWAFVGTQFIVSAPAIADGPDTLWTRTYGGTSSDYGFSVQECAGGGFIIAGGTSSFGAGLGDVYLIRTDADGDTLWTKTYGGTDYDYGYSVQQCAGGGFIIAGGTSSFGAGLGDVYLIRTDADGDTLWTKTYGGTDYDYGYSVQQCADGGFILTGDTKSFGAGKWDIYLIRTNSDGDTLWTKTYGGTDDDYVESVQETQDSGFVIAGGTLSFGAGSWDVYLVRTNADGDTVWTKTYGGTSWDWGYSVQECDEGGFIIAGESGYDVYLIRTNSNGDTLWTKTYGGTDFDYGKSVQECASGGFIIAGYTRSFGAGLNDVYLIRTDADGDTLWTRTYGRIDHDCGYSVQECAGGGFIIAGNTSSFGTSGTDVYLIRTDAQGDTLWTKTYGGTNWDDYGYSVQECASGGFIIAGTTGSFGAGLSDVYLIRISETGVEEETGNRHKAIGISLEVYPNPSLGKAVIKLLSHQAIKGASIKIYDLSGKLVKQVLTTKQDVEINLEELTNGIYFVRVETHTGLVTNNYKATRKLTIIR